MPWKFWSKTLKSFLEWHVEDKKVNKQQQQQQQQQQQTKMTTTTTNKNDVDIWQGNFHLQHLFGMAAMPVPLLFGDCIHGNSQAWFRNDPLYLSIHFRLAY